MNTYESYLKGLIEPKIDQGEHVKLSGYFRGYLYNSRSIGVMFNAAKLKGYFIAITDKNLFVVETRASATNKPLIENKNSYTVPLESIQVESVTAEGIAIRTGPESGINMEMFASNKYFPNQIKLIEKLHSQSKNVESIDEIIRKSDKKHLKDKADLYFIFLIPIFILLAMMLIDI